MCRNVSHVVLSHFGAQLCEDPNSVAFHLLLLSYQDEGGRRQGAWRFAAETKGLVGKKETSPASAYSTRPTRADEIGLSAGGVSWLAPRKGTLWHLKFVIIEGVGGGMADEMETETSNVSSSVEPDRKTRWFESTAYAIVVSLAIVELVHLVYTQLLTRF
jgi:hypothetical protein